MREAAAAAKAGDKAVALAKLEAAAQLRPDYPRLQLNLARAYAGLGRPEDAFAALQRLVDMGVQMNHLAADPGLAPLKDLPRFQTLVEALKPGLTVLDEADEAAFALPGVTGIIESCLVDPQTLLWYFGDVRNRCIWVRDVSAGIAVLKKFTADEDALDGVFKLALSPDRQTLWAATATVGAMAGPDAEDGKRTALVAIDFATGRVRARYPVPADGSKHLLGDFTFTPDGSIYATDSLSPQIWRLQPGATELSLWMQNSEFASLQGIAASADGRELFVADYANGIWRVALDESAISRLTPPANATFFGIDGLYAIPGGLLAVQNGVEPQRVLRIEPRRDTPSPTRVAAALRRDMTDLALGQVLNGRFHFVGNSGWALFDPPPATPPAPRTVTILSTTLE